MGWGEAGVRVWGFWKFTEEARNLGGIESRVRDWVSGGLEGFEGERGWVWEGRGQGLGNWG